MLILTRFAGQSIMIGDDIRMTILQNGGGIVRIGITAPRELPVHRMEIYNKIHLEKIAIEEDFEETLE